MKSTYLAIFALLAASSMATDLFAGSADPLVFYRNPDGVISQQSRENAREMEAIARTNGQITLWLVLNHPFNVHVEEMTPDENRQQSAAVERGFDELLAPLLSSGDVWHPKAGPLIKGPGSAIRANSAGLRRLLRDERILQLLAIE